MLSGPKIIWNYHKKAEDKVKTVNFFLYKIKKSTNYELIHQFYYRENWTKKGVKHVL